MSRVFCYRDVPVPPPVMRATRPFTEKRRSRSAGAAGVAMVGFGWFWVMGGRECVKSGEAESPPRRTSGRKEYSKYE